MKGATLASEKVSKFVLDDFNSFQNLVLVSSTGNDHLTATEDEADNLRIIKSIDESRELLRLVFNLVERKVEREVVEIQLSRFTSEWSACEFVVSIIVFRIMESVGCNHVLDFNFNVLEVPCCNASGSKVLDHAIDTCVNVVLVLSSSTNGSSRAEHEDGKFWVGYAINNTRELLRFILTVELNCNVWEVEFFGYAGTCYNIDDCQALFIGGHGLWLQARIYKGKADVLMGYLLV
jgi:hypothetical protein